MSSFSLISLSVVHSVIGLLHWCYQRSRGYPYPVSIRINQKGGIYFLARKAYFQGDDEVVLCGVVRADSRAPAVTEEWPVSEESVRVESVRNIVCWTAWGFSKRRVSAGKTETMAPVSVTRLTRSSRRRELATEQS